MGALVDTFMPHIVFCYDVDTSGPIGRPSEEIGFIGMAVTEMGPGHVLVEPILHNHDALIVPNEYVAGVV